MKIFLNAKELQDGLAIVSKSLQFVQPNGRDTINFSIIKETTIIYAKTLITIWTSITNMGVETDSTSEEKAFAVSGKLFTEIIKKCNDKVEIDVDKQITIKSANLEVKLPRFAVEPLPTYSDSTDKISITATDFITATQNCLCCVSSDQCRPVLQGMNFKYNNLNDYIDVVAIDGYRLAKAIIPNITKTSDFEFTLFGKFVELINSALSITASETFSISIINDKLLKIDLNATSFTAPLINDKFIDYAKIIPTNTLYAEIDPTELSKAIATVQLFSKNLSNNLVTLKFNDSVKSASIYSIAEVGECYATIPFSGSVQDDFTIAFNAKYITEALKNTADEKVTLTFSKSDRPFELKTQTCYYMILPIRISG